MEYKTFKVIYLKGRGAYHQRKIMADNIINFSYNIPTIEDFFTGFIKLHPGNFI